MKCFLDKNLADYGNHFFWDIPVERVPHALLVGQVRLLRLKYYWLALLTPTQEPRS